MAVPYCVLDCELVVKDGIHILFVLDVIVMPGGGIVSRNRSYALILSVTKQLARMDITLYARGLNSTINAAKDACWKLEKLSIPCDGVVAIWKGRIVQYKIKDETTIDMLYKDHHMYVSGSDVPVCEMSVDYDNDSIHELIVAVSPRIAQGTIQSRGMFGL
jgi:hypothetical protein